MSAAAQPPAAPIVPNEEDDPCEFLPWDSEFFRIRIARVRQDRIDKPLARRIDAWCAGHQIDCLYFLARSDDAITAETAHAFSYRPVDVRITLEAALQPASQAEAAGPGGESTVRPCRADDVTTLEAIARASFRDSRFYFDENFTASSCDALYALWLNKSCHASLRGQGAVLVADQNGKPAGFVACESDAVHHTGSISLFAVSSMHQGHGMGKTLVRAALDWFTGHNLKSASVVTQARNVAAQRLYQRGGFLTREVQLHYHKWYKPPQARPSHNA